MAEYTSEVVSCPNCQRSMGPVNEMASGPTLGERLAVCHRCCRSYVLWYDNISHDVRLRDVMPPVVDGPRLVVRLGRQDGSMVNLFEVPGKDYPEVVVYEGNVYGDAYRFFRGVKGEYLQLFAYDLNLGEFKGVPRDSIVHPPLDLSEQARAVADHVDAGLVLEHLTEPLGPSLEQRMLTTPSRYRGKVRVAARSYSAYKAYVSGARAAAWGLTVKTTEYLGNEDQLRGLDPHRTLVLVIGPDTHVLLRGGGPILAYTCVAWDRVTSDRWDEPAGCPLEEFFLGRGE